MENLGTSSSMLCFAELFGWLVCAPLPLAFLSSLHPLRLRGKERCPTPFPCSQEGKELWFGAAWLLSIHNSSS